MLSGMSQELVTLINSNRCSFTKLWKIDIDQNYYSLYREDNVNVDLRICQDLRYSPCHRIEKNRERLSNLALAIDIQRH